MKFIYSVVLSSILMGAVAQADETAAATLVLGNGGWAEFDPSCGVDIQEHNKIESLSKISTDKDADTKCKAINKSYTASRLGDYSFTFSCLYRATVFRIESQANYQCRIVSRLEGQNYIIPANPVDDNAVLGIIKNAAELVSTGTYDGVDPSGLKCTVGVELEITNKNSYFLVVPPPTRVDFNEPFNPNGEGAGPIFIPYYSFVKPTGNLNGELEVVIAQDTRGSKRLVVYKIVGKSGLPFSIEGAEGDPSQHNPLPGQSITINRYFPPCSNLIKRALN